MKNAMVGFLLFLCMVVMIPDASADQATKDRLQVKVSFDFEQASLFDVIKVLEKRGRFEIRIHPKLFEKWGNKVPKITLKADAITLEKALDKITWPLGAVIKVKKGIVWLKPKVFIKQTQREIHLHNYDPVHSKRHGGRGRAYHSAGRNEWVR